MQATIEIGLRRIREEMLYVSREAVARRTQSVSIGTIRNAERGYRVRRSNACQLLEAINALLQERGKPVITLADLGLEVC